MARDASYFAIIARAREAQQQAIIDATVDMADKATAEDWQVVRLRIWARQWQAAKLAPKQFGERMRHEVEAEVVLSTPEQRKRRIAALLKKLGRGVPPTIDRPDPARRVGTCHAAWKRP
jgi:hypothetical protein